MGKNMEKEQFLVKFQACTYVAMQLKSRKKRFLINFQATERKKKERKSTGFLRQGKKVKKTVSGKLPSKQNGTKSKGNTKEAE